MTPFSLRSFMVIALTLFTALILSILPWSKWVVVLQPQWLVLVVIYWVMMLPYRVSLGTAWLTGLLLDVLYGSVLGEHAMALAIIAYLVEKLHRQFQVFPILQQAFFVGLLIILYQGLVVWLQGMLGELSNVRWFWISSLTSFLLWPVIFFFLQGLQRKFRVN